MPVEEIFGGFDEVPRPTTSRRAVALLDVLGFRQNIESVPLPDLAQRYEAALEGVMRLLSAGDDPAEPEPLRRAVECLRFVFSDTVILVSTDDTEDAAEDVLFCAWRMSQFFIAGGLPLRGGVAFGDMYANPGRQVFLGKALTDAYILEQRQQWVGTAIDESVIQQFPRLFPEDPNDYATGIFPSYPVPLKDGTTRIMRTVNWRAQFVAEHGIRELLPEGVDDASREKIAHTLAFAAEMRRRGYAFRSPYFHRIAPLFVTDNPQSEEISHGDEY